jgi:hypothetical protein
MAQETEAETEKRKKKEKVKIKNFHFLGIRAVPPHVHVSVGDDIEWTVPDADEDTEATLFFPAAATVFGAGTPIIQSFDAHDGITLTVTGGHGKQPYTISCVVDGDVKLAEGFSPPEVIIN